MEKSDRLLPLFCKGDNLLFFDRRWFLPFKNINNYRRVRLTHHHPWCMRRTLRYSAFYLELELGGIWGFMNYVVVKIYDDRFT